MALKRSGTALSTKLYESFIWPPTNSGDNWPDAGGCAPNADLWVAQAPPWTLVQEYMNSRHGGRVIIPPHGPEGVSPPPPAVWERRGGYAYPGLGPGEPFNMQLAIKIIF